MHSKRIIYTGLLLVLVASSILAPLQAAAIRDPLFFSQNNIDHYQDECINNDNISAVQLAGNDNTEKILNFLMRKGLSLAQASGIVGNMMQESGLKPDIIEGGATAGPDYKPQNGKGFGLVQWTFTPRQDPLVKLAGQMGKPVTDMSVQLEYVWQELNGGWVGTLNKLRATNDPVEAAVIVHDGYEVSADSTGAVRSVRGGNAKKVFDKYKDAPALAGAEADANMNQPEGSLQGPKSATNSRTNPKSGCKQNDFAGGNLTETLKAYAWPQWKGMTVEAQPAYTKAVSEAQAQGLYIGSKGDGGRIPPGIDCGGFTTLLIRNSKHDSGFNYDGRGGNTTTQEEWMRANWQHIGSSASINAAELQPGDVAINGAHTFIYVGEVDGFQAKIASASWDERAPMADPHQSPNQPGYNWYRKKK